MPQVNNVEHLRAWFRGCPALSSENRFRVDYLSEEPTEYAIYASPSTLTYRENVLGESVPMDVQSLNFIFASREPFGADEQQNLENNAFYQDVVSWMVEQNAKRNFPRINEGRVTAIETTLTQYVSAPGVSSAKYQIQFKATYRRY